MGTRRTEAESASLFGWEAAAPVAVVPLGPDPWAVTDELGTAPMFAAPVGPGDARHAPVPAVCDWPVTCRIEGCDEGDTGAVHDPRCGRVAVAVYSMGDVRYPRCARHDTAAARRWAAADGWRRDEIGGA